MTISSRHSNELLDRAFGRLAISEPGWEDRPAQRDMARLWGETLERGGALAVEAPTGVGKSLAYLLPALIRRARGSGPVLVSTCTKTLQDQLFRHDVPLAMRALGRAPRVVTLKGRQNYLCRRRAAARLAQGSLFQESGLTPHAREALREWVERTERGELEELAEIGIVVPQALLSEIASDPLVCSGTACEASNGCFAKRARREALRADIVLLNHALLLSDPGLRASLVAEAGALVLDEAHHVERVAREQLGITVGMQDVLRLLARTDSRSGSLRALHRALRRGRGGAVLAAIQAAEGEIPAVLRNATAFARDLERVFPPGASAARIGRDLDIAAVSPMALDGLLAALGSLSRALTDLVDLADREGQAAMKADGLLALDEIRARALAWSEMERALRAAVGLTERGYAFYLDRDDRGGPRLNKRPVHVGSALRQTLLTLCDRVLLTSATLRAGDDFAPLLEALGFGEDEVQAVALPSPFPLERQVFCAVWDGMTPNDPDYAVRLADFIVDLATRVRRNTLVLLTSYQMLDRVAERCEPALKNAGIPLLRQAPGEAAHAIASEFRAGQEAVLLGTASFWEGVDFPGEALEVLVIARLPFGVPTDPLMEARSERVMEQGGDPFRDLALPEALLRFRQGIGRLIRTSRDRGAVIVADPRLWRAPYGRLFAGALPSKPIVTSSPSEIRERVGAWFTEEEAPCPA